MDATNKLINDAKLQLKEWKKAGAVVADDQRQFYESLAKRLCPTCKRKLKVVFYSENETSSAYKYGCGHGYKTISLKDEIKINDTLVLKQFRKGFGLLKKLLTGYRPSGDPRLSKGVTVNMEVDRENNKYDHKVVDNITGKVIHEEHESLKEHSTKQKFKKAQDKT